MELLIVVLILSISAAVVIPYATGMNESAALAASRMVAADLQYAQESAIATGQEVTVLFDLEDKSYTLSSQSGTLIHPITKKAYEIHLASQQGMSSMRIVSAFGAARSIRFDPTGMPSEGGQVVVQSAGRQYAVSVDASSAIVTVEPVR